MGIRDIILKQNKHILSKGVEKLLIKSGMKL